MNNRTTPKEIKKLKKNEIFVFGSNAQGNNAGGAARLAKEKFGAVEGIARGRTGDCYAIDTMSGFEIIKEQIQPFIEATKVLPLCKFLVTEIGCGIAGFTHEQIAPLFREAMSIENIHLPESFLKILNAKQIIRGYKVFNPNFTSKEKNFKYSENTEFFHKGEIKICQSGFHFCIKASHCFSYYSFSPENIVCEVEARGKTETHSDDSKVVTDILFVGRRLTWLEVLQVSNEGKENTGHSNSGNSNSGDSNSGNRNSGNSNSGNSNSGYRNSGNSNSGNRNSGNRNSGYRNSGNRNSGDSNSGNSNSGDSNSGDSNSGYSNSGDSNSGNSNSGNSNSGDSNSGNRNSGNRNSGDSNSGYRNSGAFCTELNPTLYLFNKPTKMNIKEWEGSKAVNLMYSIETTLWIPFSLMNKEEKESHPKAETCEGYLKTIPIKESWQNAWGNWSDENKKVFTSLPNFTRDIFLEITGIDVNL